MESGYLDRAGAAKDTGEHGDALFGEGHRAGSAEFATAWYHIL